MFVCMLHWLVVTYIHVVGINIKIKFILIHLLSSLVSADHKRIQPKQDHWFSLRFVCVCVCPAEDDQKEKSLSHHTIQQLILEKDQALADLNSVEKSLADLFRRYEKMKDVLDGFRKVTDWLLMCVFGLTGDVSLLLDVGCSPSPGS